MKKICKILSAIFVLSLSFMSPVNAVELRYAGCPEGGRHSMEVVARAIMYEGTYQNPGKLITTGGKYYKCTKCDMGIVTQFSPHVSGCLGAYIFDSRNYTGSALVVSYGVEGYEWSWPTGYIWDGMDWLD